MLQVRNSMGRHLEAFKPLKDKFVSIYQCGPTVYWTQHIGNMRAMLMGDLIRRSLMYLGYQVKYVRNYTDFGHLTSDADTGEDKMEKAAKRENLSPKIIAEKYIRQFENDTGRLHILEPDIKARATDYIQDMIAMVKILLEKGYAYSTPGAIYFDISKFPKYTELSGQDLEQNKTGAGFGSIEDKEKRHPEDFALWFFRTGAHQNALQYWPSPFVSEKVEKGFGFPGWHIECSAMIRKLLGNTIDIHMGGVEHIPIHHTNEIAQSESANGVKFVNYWLHNEHLTVDNEKMSKSAGTGFVLDDIIKRGFQPADLRYFFLQAHYRSKQNFTWDSLLGAKKARERLQNSVLALGDNKKGKIISGLQDQFSKALEDDFNVPLALAVVWDLIKSKDKYPAEDILATILKFDKVLGLDLGEKQESGTISSEFPQAAKELLAERELARKKKDFAKADNLRRELKEKFNIDVTDTALT